MGIDIDTHRVFVTQRGAHGAVAVLRDESLETVADTAGLKTVWFCTEGSTRAGIQEYLTLLSETDQTVIVSYFLNTGPGPVLPQVLPAGTRTTRDVNAVVGPEVDVSVKIVGQNDFFVERPMYFNRSIGAAGPVNGGQNTQCLHS